MIKNPIFLWAAGAAGLVVIGLVGYILVLQKDKVNLESRNTVLTIERDSAQATAAIVQSHTAQIRGIELSIKAIADDVAEANRTIQQELDNAPILSDPDLMCLPAGAIR